MTVKSQAKVFAAMVMSIAAPDGLYKDILRRWVGEVRENGARRFVEADIPEAELAAQFRAAHAKID